MNRDEMIDWLIGDDIGIVRDGAWGYFADIVNDGFKGYQSYTDEELRLDILERDPEGFSHNLNKKD
jgi:hypothetical protein